MELPGILWMVVPYFILGCLLFAASMACVGTFAGSVREAQQSVQVFLLLAVLPLLFLSSISQSPNSIVARILTYIPYTCPVTTMMRLSLTEVPLFEIIASIILLFISVIVMIRLSARIFRIEILMYGKKANLRNILRYLKG
jgi:ABC-2 type transport system permease protein